MILRSYSTVWNTTTIEEFIWNKAMIVWTENFSWNEEMYVSDFEIERE